MKTLLPLIKTKLFLLSFLVTSSVIIATTIPITTAIKKETGQPVKRSETGDKEIQPQKEKAVESPLFIQAIQQVSPASGTTLGGTSVTIIGSGFTPPGASYTVAFDGIAATSVVRVSNSVITAVTPAHVSGTVSVTVGINGTEVTADNLYTYVCTTPANLIFTESMGTVAAGPATSIAAHEAANGFDNDSYTMSGTADLRSSSQSTDYFGASAGANVFLTNTPGRDFQITGINTTGFAKLELSFGIFKNLTTSDGSDLIVEVSSDGVSFTPLLFPVLPTGTGSVDWHYRIAEGTIPAVSNLTIRFRQTGSATQYRIDDIRLVASPPITSQPADLLRCVGSSATFSVTALGTGLTYQWQKGRANIAGATGDSYTIPSVVMSDAGSYHVVIIETCTGLVTFSDAATLSIDMTPPVAILSATFPLGCNPVASDINAALGFATVSDNCGIPTLTVTDGAVQSSGCSRSQTRTFTVIDNTGNFLIASRTVTWTSDLTPPTLSILGTSTTLGCNPTVAAINAALGIASAFDACGAPTLLSSDGPVQSSGCNRVQTRTFIARDACNNISSTSRTVTWTSDPVAPVISTSGTTLTLGCNPTIAAINAALGIAAAFDACGAPTITVTDGAVASSGCNRTQTRTWFARDGCNNSSGASRTVTWRVDVTPPALGVSGTTTNLGCNPTVAAINAALGIASAFDACGAPTLLSSDGPVQSSGCNRTQTRTFIARDACNNISSASRTVTWTSDPVAPVISTSGTTLTLGCNPTIADINAALGIAAAFDACGAPTISVTDGAVASSGCNRTQTRTWFARDGCNNTSGASRTVTWRVDVTPPALGVSGTTTNLGCNPTVAAINAALGNASAFDACGAPTLLSSDGPVQSSGCNRVQTRTFIARDACNNISSASRTVTWTSDPVAPVISTSGTTLTLGCNPTIAAINAALGIAAAFDACGAPTITVTDGAVTSSGCNRTQTRTWFARDGCNNSSGASRTVTWRVDVTPPALGVSGTTTNLGCNPTVAAINAALGIASAFDACGAPTLLSSDGPVQSSGCNRVQTRTFIARDACNNISSASRTVTWTSDPVAPVITSSGTTLTLGCNPTIAAINAALGIAAAFDACGAPTITVTDGAVVSNGCNRSQTRTWFARDACNNSSGASRTVTWRVDVTPPALGVSGTTTNLGCNPTVAAINAALGIASAFDACGAPTLLSSDGPVQSSGCNRVQTRTFIAIDACNNISSVSRTVTWTSDPDPPVFSGSNSTVNLGCNPSATTIAATLAGAAAFDACGAPTLTASDGPVISSGCNRSQTRTFMAIDGCGNTSSISRTVNWIFDIIAPAINVISGSVDLGCSPSASAIDEALGIATAFDECGAPRLVVSTGAIASSGCNRIQTRTFVAIDACGNMTSATRTVSWIDDPDPPAFIGSYSTVNLGCNPSATTIATTLDGATAFDACGAPTLTAADGAVISSGCNRSQTRTFMALDGCGNTSSVSRTVNWFTDNIPPVITISGPSNLGCNPDPAAIDAALGVASAFDACASPTLLTTTGAVVINGCNRSQTRTFTSNDACGNFAIAFRTVTWIVDVTPPAFSGDYATVVLGVDPDPDEIAAALDGATAFDACGAPTLTFSDGPVISIDCDRSQTRTFTAIDGCNNIATISRTVIWLCGQALLRSAKTDKHFEIVPFNVKAFPNPTEHQFTLYLEGASNEKVQIVVYDVVGRLVKKIEKGDASGAIRFGEDLKVGAYIVEVRQGVNRKTLKLVKQ